MREAGKLGAFLLQLSPSFSPHKHKLDELEQLASLFRDERLAIELRNRNWLTEPNRAETLAFFQSKQLPIVLVDAPESEHFTVMQSENLVTSPKLAYLRLHGRNERGYIAGKSVAERFNYDYSDDEIAGVVMRVRGSPRKPKKSMSPSTTTTLSTRPSRLSLLKPRWALRESSLSKRNEFDSLRMAFNTRIGPKSYFGAKRKLDPLSRKTRPRPQAQLCHSSD